MAELETKTIEAAGEAVPFAQTEEHSSLLAKLYSSHSSALYKIALRKLGNPEDAEDALQEGLMSAFRHMNQFRGEAQMSTWLTTIVLNAARMQLRRRSRRKFVPIDGRDDEDGLALLELLKDGAPNPEETLRSTQLRETIERLSGELSPKIRLAFRLRVLEGLSTREAAELIGISEGTLKARLFRAYRQIAPRLRNALQPPRKRVVPMRKPREGAFEYRALAMSSGRSRSRSAA